MGYIAHSTVEDGDRAGTFHVLIYSNRKDVKGCVEQHDKSCKHPESGGPAKQRTRPLTVSMNNYWDAVAFSQALMTPSEIQTQAAPIGGFDSSASKWGSVSSGRGKLRGRLTDV